MSADWKSANPEVVALNIIRTHGVNVLDRLRSGDSNQAIADDVGVTRERVRQWRTVLAVKVTHFQLHPEVKAVLDEDEL